MKRFLTTMLLLALAGFGYASLTASQGDHQSGAPIKKETLTLTGSSTVAPVAAEIAKRFEAQNPGVRIDVQTGGSSRGIADTRKRLAHIGMVSRALKESETALHAFTIAKDGITIIVHKENPLNGLSTAQIKAIYRGEIDNWSAFGGPDRAIIVVNKAEGRSTLELFQKFFSLKSSDIKADVIIGDNEQGIKTVAGNAHAIGYVSIGSAEYNANNGTPIKLVPINGIAPTRQAVANGVFPLSRPLNLVTLDEPKDTVKSFIRFASSPATADLIRGLYFVPAH